MRSYLKFVTQILAIILFLAVEQCVSVPAVPRPSKPPNDAITLQDVACHSTPSSKLSSYCLANLTDQENSVLTNFNNACEHAAYLTQKICQVLQPDSDMLTKTDSEIKEVLKYTTDNDTFCRIFLNRQKELGYVDKTAKTTLNKCVQTCIDDDKVKPICNYILWSWEFLKNHAKDDNVPSVIDPPPENPGGLEKMPVVEKKPQASGDASNGSGPTPAPVPKPAKVESEKNIKPVDEDDGLAGDIPEVDNGEEPPKSAGSAENAENSPIEKKDPEKPGAEKSGAEKSGAEKSGAEKSGADKSGAEPNPPANAHLIEDQSTPKKHITPATPESLKTEAEEDTSNIGRVDNARDEEDNGPEEDEPRKPQAPEFPSKGDQTSTKELEGAQAQGDDTEDDQDETPEAEKVNNNRVVDRPKESEISRGSNFDDSEDSHVFVFFVVGTFICILFYFIYLNKRKIIAMALEGKKGRHSTRRRPTTASYQKLDNKLDEVMASSPQPSKTHVIY